MSGNPMDNVVLLPQTVDYYQIELTRMLETERYGEAIELLSFLLSCRPVDERTDEEWQSLLQWLKSMFPDDARPLLAEEKEWTESDLYRQHLRAKTESDERYADKLIGMLKPPASLEQQILALEQLTYIDHPQIDDAVKMWLRKSELHPLIQFKGLQALKIRGASGSVRLPRNGGTLLVDIEETPLGPDEFPAEIAEIMSKVQQSSEMDEPELARFAEQMWSDFLAFIYGTPVYHRLKHLGPEGIDAWAAALHTLLIETMHGAADRREIREMYAITSELEPAYEHAYQTLHKIAGRVSSADS